MKLNIAGIVYDAGNSTKNKTGNWRTFRPIITEKCTGCGICVQFCPEGCIELVDRKGKLPKIAKVDFDYCKGCMICWKECPFKAIEKEQERK